MASLELSLSAVDLLVLVAVLALAPPFSSAAVLRHSPKNRPTTSVFSSFSRLPLRTSVLACSPLPAC